MNKRRLAFRLGAIALLVVIAACMMVIGRGHTVYVDNKSLDYNGETFRSLWQDYRENTGNDGDPDHCVFTAEIVVPSKPKGTRVVCVKAVDVFGFESVATVRV